MGFISGLFNHSYEILVQSEYGLLIFAAISVILLSQAGRFLYVTQKEGEPPVVPYSFPFVGHAISFGMDPIKFMKDCYEKYGECFTFVMMAISITNPG
jgi:sterol 14-demethylase